MKNLVVLVNVQIFLLNYIGQIRRLIIISVPFSLIDQREGWTRALVSSMRRRCATLPMSFT